jgi:hypothetical protein
MFAHVCDCDEPILSSSKMRPAIAHPELRTFRPLSLTPLGNSSYRTPPEFQIPMPFHTNEVASHLNNPKGNLPENALSPHIFALISLFHSISVFITVKL